MNAQLDFGFRVPPRQLALNWARDDAPARADVVEAPALAPALALLDRWPVWPGPVAALTGPAGCGKTHLARVWAAMAEAVILSPERLDGLDAAALGPRAVLIEDVSEIVLRRHATAIGLFHLVNHVRGAGAHLLLTSRSDPGAWSIDPPDLASRLRAATIVAVPPPDEATMTAVMGKLLADRQLPVDPGLIEFAVARLDRSLAAVRDLVHALDRRALCTGRPVTRRMVASALA